MTLAAFDSDGRATRTVQIPADLELDIGPDHAIALRRESLGMPSAVIMRLAQVGTARDDPH